MNNYRFPSKSYFTLEAVEHLVQARLRGVQTTMIEALKSNDTVTAYKMKGAEDICNEILKDLDVLMKEDSV